MSPFRPVVVLAPFALCALGSAQTVTLRFKPPVGKTVSYVTTTSMVQEIPGMSTPMGMTQTMPMTYRVVSRSGGATTVQTKTGQVRVTMPAGSPMAAQKATIEKMASGMTSTMVVDELGNLKGTSASGAPGAAMTRQIGAGMTAGAQGVCYPARPLKVGDAWSASLDMGKTMGAASPMGMKATGTIPIVYRLVGIERRGGATLAKIATTMRGTTSMTMGGMGGGKGQSMSMTLKMDSTGTMVVDASTGLFQSMATAMDMDTAIMGRNMKQKLAITMKAQ